jgi:hypothetical protein
MSKTETEKRYVWHVVTEEGFPSFNAVFDTTQVVGTAIHSCGFYMVASFDESIDLVEILYFMDAMNARDARGEK